MPRSKAQKRQTHERIVQTAAQAFRAEGIDGIGIADVMRQAGLTHGGFYAHFAGKDTLVAEACAQGLTESNASFAATIANAAPGQEIPAFIRAYLSRAHRDAPASGCVIATLAAEIAREPTQVRHLFTEALGRYTSQLAAHLDTPEVAAETQDDAAYMLLAGLAGVMLLARAVDDPTLSDHILRAGRRFCTHAFAPPEVAEKPGVPPAAGG